MLPMSSTFQQPVLEGAGKPELDVFYDADCGFCTRTAALLRRVDRSGRLRLMPLQRATEITADAPPEDRLLEEMHVRDSSGRWVAGGAAWLQIAHVVPLMKPLAFVAELPVLRSLVEPAYAVIARNRHRISRLMGDGDCSLDRNRA
jgi:predicted DCC family thiol-disulfide oxidoreductase YuxK